MSDIHVVILAAGQGTRMKSALPKVLHKISGLSLVEHVLRLARSVAPATITVIVGHKVALVREHLAGDDAIRERDLPRVALNLGVENKPLREPRVNGADVLERVPNPIGQRLDVNFLVDGSHKTDVIVR